MLRYDMNTSPAVSVIMPVYNADRYVAKAVESILGQTFTDFELIIVNDCSTDNSDKIIRSFTDGRIIYFRLEQNAGVVAAMNKGLELSGGEFIAVMHADDISLPQRLQAQVSFLRQHKDVAVVASPSVFIDEDNNPTGATWQLNDATDTFRKIKTAMIWENCISHPTVMIRTDVAKKYRYQSSKMHKGFAVEDYPLWLNILSDGYKIEKLKEPLLLYRVHTNSATTAFLRKRNPFLVNYHSKKSYLQNRKKKGRLTAFDRMVQITMYLDYLKAVGKNIKRTFIPHKR
jgi:glycosyltransferase involved in cell wall biosynthesis